MSRAAIGPALVSAARATVPACLGFYLCAYLLGSTEMAAYAVFGVLALGAFSHVDGTGRQRTRTYLWSLVVGLALVTLGTALAGNAIAAAAGMLLVGFAVAFAGVGGPRLAGPAVGLQLFYILPCFPPYSPGSLDDRLIALTIGVLLLTIADRLLWPPADPAGFRPRLIEGIEQTVRFAHALRPAVGGQADGASSPDQTLTAARRDALQAVYLQNAIRLALGLALARLLVDVLALEHGLWVLLATLTLMRTSAAATRAALLPAYVGVIIGAALGGLLLFALGPSSSVYARAAAGHAGCPRRAPAARSGGRPGRCDVVDRVAVRPARTGRLAAR